MSAWIPSLKTSYMRRKIESMSELYFHPWYLYPYPGDRSSLPPSSSYKDNTKALFIGLRE